MARLGVLVLVALLAAATAQAQGSLEPKLRYGFYKRLCPYAEDIVREAVRNATNVNPGLSSAPASSAWPSTTASSRYVN